jgi:hypothetical protein
MKAVATTVPIKLSNMLNHSSGWAVLGYRACTSLSAMTIGQLRD